MGRSSVNATRSTSGSRSTRGTTSASVPPSSGLRPDSVDRSMPANTSRSSSTPMSTAWMCCRLRTNEPGAGEQHARKRNLGSQQAVPNGRSVRRAVASSAPKHAVRFGRLAWSAGASPAASPARIAVASANAMTRDPTAGTPHCTRGRIACRSAVAVQAATNTAARLPMTASTTLSVSSCATRRARLTPRASRMPISRRRCRARASRRFATFAQAISRMTKATTASLVAMASSFPRKPGGIICFSEPKLAASVDVSRRFAQARFNAAVAAACKRRHRAASPAYAPTCG